jgi:hypothetical protein
MKSGAVPYAAEGIGAASAAYAMHSRAPEGVSAQADSRASKKVES